MSVIDEAKAKIKGRALKLVMPEGDDERIRATAERFRLEGLAEPIVFGRRVQIFQRLELHRDQHLSVLRELRFNIVVHVTARQAELPRIRSIRRIAAEQQSHIAHGCIARDHKRHKHVGSHIL